MSLPTSSAAALAASGREPPVPCALTLDDGNRLELLRPLRVLPGKRITGEGSWKGQPVLAKLFVAPSSARHWQREHEGVRALARAGIPTPPVLAAGTLAGGGHYLLTAFLPAARSLADALPADTADAAALFPLLEAACGRIGQMHAQGLIHDDLHLGNFLIDSGSLLVIDGEAVRRCAAPLPEKEILANLADFFTQLPIETPLEPLLAAWRGACPQHAAIDSAKLQPFIEHYLHTRLEGYLRKTLRPCTLFDVRQSFRRFTAVAREDADWLAPLLDDPDAVMASGVFIKDSNTAAVARITLAGRPLIIKRYNIKSAAHALSRAWRPSRAWHSWREGHRLCFLGIPTPKPRALIEERLGPLRRRAWLVADDCPGPDLLQHLAPCVHAPAPPEAEAQTLLRLMESLYRMRISHGDLKANNLLWDGNRIALIDLDSMTQHASAAAFARRWKKDRARLLANWPVASGLRRWLDAHLRKA